ncbi:MAG: hypothetical protein QHH44_08565, partial [Candidatus Saccharicenans sp.]|nr:hypothetical protein [Candidatus Saccharicenans sp.]
MDKSLKPGVAALLLCLLTLNLFPQSRPALNKPAENFTQVLSSAQNLLSEGHYSRAQKMFLQSLSLAKTPEEKKSALFSLAESNASLGQLAQAYERYYECLVIAKKVGDSRTIKYCETSLQILDLFNEAKTHRQANKDEMALVSINKAIVLCDSIDNDILKMKCLRRKGMSLLTLNEMDEYLKISLEANKIAKRLKNSYEIIITLNNIGYYHFANNNLTLAIDYFSQGISFINEDTQPQDIFDIYYNLG